METKVTLQAWTTNPIGTIAAMWHASRETTPCPDPKDIDPNDPKVVELFQKVIESHLPVADGLNFVFLIENASISLREQMVRHRVGVRFGDRVGIDYVPELGSSSWWTQGMRILDMTTFATERKYRIPPSIEEKPKLLGLYHSTMLTIQQCYSELVDAGIQREDAREIIPLGAQHSLNWVINLSALKHIISKRSCWIPQVGLWEPVIRGMVNELSNKVHPLFRNLINPPCIKNNKFAECLFKLDNEKRIKGEDEPTPCSLYIEHYQPELKKPSTFIQTMGRAKADVFATQKAAFTELWMRNPWTGEPIKKHEEVVEEGDSMSEGWS
jgi:thymidylate synthase ThyX